MRDFARAINPAPPAGEVPFLIAPRTDVQWGTEVELSYLKIPGVFRRIVADADRVFILATRPPDIGRDSAEPDKDDFYQRSDIEIGGFYSPSQKAIVVLQEAFSKVRNAYRKGSKTAQLTVHEFTHALDDILKISELPEALAAYALDDLSLSGSPFRKNFGYLLQDGPRGPQEAIAEEGSTIWTGSSITGGVGDFHWRRLTTWTTAFLASVEKNYDPAKGVTTEFVQAAAHDAERDLLHTLMNEDVLQDAMRNTYFRDKDIWGDKAAYYGGYSVVSPEKKRKKRVLRDIVERQGLEEAVLAYEEHEKLISSLGPIQFP